MADVARTTKKIVLQRAKLLLENSHVKYRNRVFVMSQDILPDNIRDHDLITVSLAGGQFAYGEQAGSGNRVVPYQGTLRVSVWKTSRIDRQGTDDAVMLTSSEGILDFQLAVLKALLGSYFNTHTDGYSPPILTQACYAVSDTEMARTEPVAVGKLPSGDMYQALLSMDFGVDFHWDLDLE